MKRISVIDSSCLINLSFLQLAPFLVHYFDRVYVPRRVQEEVSRKHKFRYRLKKLYQTGLFEKCLCGDRYNVELLAREIDGGEAEALVQAQEKAAQFFVADETRARQIGERQGLIAVGTVRILARLCLEGYAEDTHVLIRKLRRSDLKFRVSDAVVNQAIAKRSEPF